MTKDAVTISSLQAELEKVRLDNEKLTYVFEASKIGVWEWDINSNSLTWDKQMYKLYGIKEEDFSGAYDDWIERVHPLDKIKVEKNLILSLKSKKEFHNQFRIIWPEGTVKVISAKGKVLFDEQKIPTRMIGLNLDITKDRERESTLNSLNDGLSKSLIKIANSEEKIKLALASAKIGMWDYNMENNICSRSLTLNLIFGYSELTPQWKSDFFIPDVIPEDIDNVKKYINEGYLKGSFNFTCRIKRVDDNSIRWITVAGLSYTNSKFQVYKVIGTINDITELHETNAIIEMNRTLEEKNRELNEFAYVASHDLQEPLNTISSFSGLLLKKYSDKLDEDGKRYLKYLKSSSTRSRNLIRDIIDYNRMGYGKKLSRIDCNLLLKNIILDLDSKIKKRNAHVEIKKLPIIMGYETELKILMQNLVINAIKYHDPSRQPKIVVSAQEADDKWQFEIRDNGIGIEEKYYDKIFALFRRLHTIEAYEGTGIGLSQCKKAAEMHKGTVWVDSTVGVGSTFYFTISKKLYE